MHVVSATLNIPLFLFIHTKYFYTAEEQAEYKKLLPDFKKTCKKFGFPATKVGVESLYYHHGLRFAPDFVKKNIAGKLFGDLGGYWGDSTLVFMDYSPEKVILFKQSDVHEHAELGYIMTFNSYMGEISSMTQFKDKTAKLTEGEPIHTGLFIYPTLMVADIILYDPDYVPVGVDQKQHVELTRDLAIRFNNRYSETFKVPEPVTAKTGAKINSLSNPTKKMSKSESDKGTVYLLEDLNIVRKKIMSAVTDSDNTVYFNMEEKPGISNLLTIMSAITGEDIDDIAKRYNGQGYGVFKKAVADVVVNELSDLQAKVKQIQSSGIIDKILEEGAQKASFIARKKLAKVYRKIGLR